MTYNTTSNIVNEIQMEGSQLEVGTGTRIVCPQCGGGSTKEKSMSLYRSQTTTIHATCFRASCDFGTQHVRMYSDGDTLLSARTHKHNRSNKKKPFYIHKEPIHENKKRILNEKYHLDDYKLAYARVQGTKDRRVVFPIFNPKHSVRGYVVRVVGKMHLPPHVNQVSIPKAMNQPSIDGATMQSWYFKDRHQRKASDTLIIVEDIPSALRCIDYCDSVALLGTALTPDKQKEIKAMRYKNIYLCLDADANRLIVKHIRKNAVSLPMMTKFLDCDIKDMSTEKLHTFMESVDL